MLLGRKPNVTSIPISQGTQGVGSSHVSSVERAVRLGGSLSANKTTAVIIWLIGAWLTVQALQQMGVPEQISVIFGVALQFALTRAESPMWRGRGVPKMALGAVIVDICINSAGTWPYTKQIGNTDFWKMVRDVTGNPVVEPTIPTMLAFAIGVGAFTAAAAEYFWNL